MMNIDDKTVGIWFLQISPTQDWLAHLSEVEPDKTYKLTYRFRYYDGDQSKTPFEAGDTKNWYAGTVTATRNYAVRGLRFVADRLKAVVPCSGEVYELLNDHDITAFMREFEKAPFVYVKMITKEEGERLDKEMGNG